MRTQYGLSEKHNPLLFLPIDLYQSIPIETLHSILLGPFKYLFKNQMAILSSKQKEEILARLRAFDQSGLAFKLKGDICK